MSKRASNGSHQEDKMETEMQLILCKSASVDHSTLNSKILSQSDKELTKEQTEKHHTFKNKSTQVTTEYIQKNSQIHNQQASRRLLHSALQVHGVGALILPYSSTVRASSTFCRNIKP